MSRYARPQTAPAPASIRRIAVFRALYLGDLLLAVPALRALRAAYPAAEITLIGLPWAATFAERYDRYIDRFVEFEGFPGIREVEVQPERVARFLTRQFTYTYDLVVQMHGSGATSDAFALALAGQTTVGYYDRERPDGLTFGAPYPDDQPEVLRNLGLLRLLGLPTGSTTLEFPLRQADHDEAARLLERVPDGAGPLVALHVGSRSPARRWPAAHFAALADTLARRWGARVLLTGSRDEATLVAEVAALMREPATNLAGCSSLGGLAALLSRLALVVANDTGPAHLAEAVGVPSITIFGPTDPRRWASLDQARHRLVQQPVACSPCGHWECPIDHRCLQTLTPELVLAVAGELLTEGTIACNA